MYNSIKIILVEVKYYYIWNIEPVSHMQ